MDRIEAIAKQDSLSWNDLLIILEAIERKVDMFAQYRIWDMKEELGFKRDEESQ